MAKKLRVNVEKGRAPNYAEDREYATEFAGDLLRDWYYVRSQRAERELRWQDFYDQWGVGNQDPINSRNYIGRAQLHIPQFRKEVETMTRRLTKAIFPEDYLKADPTLLNVDKDLAVCNAMVVRHYFDNVMHLKMKSAPWLKQGVLYGTSPIRTYWRKETNEMFFKKRYFDTGKNGELIPAVKKVKELVSIYDAPEAEVTDLFQTWAYPVTASTPDKVERVYHRRKVTLNDILDLVKEGVAINDKDLIEEIEQSAKQVDEQFDQTQQRFMALGESGQLRAEGVDQGEGKEGNRGRLLDLLEVWGKADIDGKMQNYRCYIINENPSWCITLSQNPYWHQKPNFDWMRFIIPPGPEFYGRSLGEAIIALQYQLDDTLNQGMDSTTLSLNQITVVNPAYAPNVESFEVEPLAIWWADPNAVKPMTFPDLSDVYIKNAQTIRGIMTEMSDNTPQLPDPLSGKARSTGQADLAMNEWQTDLYAFVEQIILEAMLPIAQKTHLLLQDKLPDNKLIKITGRYAGQWMNRIISPSDILGNMSFSWMGAVQIQNESVRTQQMLQFLKILPTIPPEERAKFNIDWGALVIKLLRDGFNVKNPEAIVSTEKENQAIDPYIENQLLKDGCMVDPNIEDDDQAHLQSHMQTMQDTKDVYTRSLIDDHIRKTMKQVEKKKQQAMAMQQQQAMEMAAHAQGQQPGGANNKSGIMQRPQPNPNGNQGQVPVSTDQDSFKKGIRP